MSARLPTRIEPRTLGGRGATLRGTLPVSRFARLLAAVAGPAADAVEVELQFDTVPPGKARAVGRVTARVQVTCQRCLEPAEIALDAPVRVVWGSDEDIQEGFDTLPLPDEAVALVDWLEDELLLVLPLAPTHAEGACLAPGAGTGARRENPFAVLAALRTGRQ